MEHERTCRARLSREHDADVAAFAERGIRTAVGAESKHDEGLVGEAGDDDPPLRVDGERVGARVSGAELRGDPTAVAEGGIEVSVTIHARDRQAMLIPEGREPGDDDAAVGEHARRVRLIGAACEVDARHPVLSERSERRAVRREALEHEVFRRSAGAQPDHDGAAVGVRDDRHRLAHRGQRRPVVGLCRRGDHEEEADLEDEDEHRNVGRRKPSDRASREDGQ